MAKKIDTTRSPKYSGRELRARLWSVLLRHAVFVTNAMGVEGLVTVVIVLGAVAILAYLNRPEWPLVVLAVAGLSVFLLFRGLSRLYLSSGAKGHPRPNARPRH